MFKTLREDIQMVFAKDPAARNVPEAFFCSPGLHALWFRRLARFLSHTSRFLTGIEIHTGPTVVEMPGRVVANRHEPLLDLEHGKLPEPISEALKFIIEEQDKLEQRVSHLEASREPVVTVGRPEKQERGGGEPMKMVITLWLMCCPKGLIQVRKLKSRRI